MKILVQLLNYCCHIVEKIKVRYSDNWYKVILVLFYDLKKQPGVIWSL